MYLEQKWPSLATGTHLDILFFRIPRTPLCKVLYRQPAGPPPRPVPRHSSPKLANYPREVINTDRNQTPWKEPQKCTLPAGECRHQAGDAHHPRAD